MRDMRRDMRTRVSGTRTGRVRDMRRTGIPRLLGPAQMAEGPSTDLNPISYNHQTLTSDSRQSARELGYLPLEEVRGRVIAVTIPIKNRERAAPIEVGDSNSAISKLAAFVSKINGDGGDDEAT